MRLLALLSPCTDCNDRFHYPFIYFNKGNPFPFTYLKVEKGTPLGRSLPVLAIIGSTSHHYQPLAHNRPLLNACSMKTGRSKLGRLYTRLVQGPLKRIDVLSFLTKLCLFQCFVYFYASRVYTRRPKLL